MTAFESRERESPGEHYWQLAGLVSNLEHQRTSLERARPSAPAPAVRPEVQRWFGCDVRQFRQQVADLCRRDGCTRVSCVGGSGESRADVTAVLPDGRKLVVQCRRQTSTLGSPVVKAFAGSVFHVHRADVALLVATCFQIAAPARDFAATAGIRLVDWNRLLAWEAKPGTPPWA
ncbi:restriction endonuclease [Kitasatospora phosalacinea]|uniref:Restriction endonuclease n=1 Tax=Kitasatospora phosalacinea TaxID=2065 RepID=A0ABW6GE35_9ACTN